MDILKERFRVRALDLFQKNRALLKTYGDIVVGETKVSQLFGGMRGMKSMIWETSQLDPFEGIRFRGYSLPKLRQALPKATGGKEPLPEGLFWLMLTGDLPTQEEVSWLTAEWKKRSEIPEHTFNLLGSLPSHTHPMTQYSLAILSMQTDSIFARRYAEGLAKDEYWDAYYEDSMNLIARLPRLAAYIYRRTYHNRGPIAPHPELDWAANFAHMLGINDSDDFKSLMRLYLTIHADHEGGNASAHTTHLVGSTLSDPYYALASGMNALAGPLHGLATQEVIKWILELIENIGTDTPTEEQLKEYTTKTLESGKVIPGYGHAVLRKPDPRYMAQRRFAEEYISDDPIVQIVWKLFSVVPPILEKWKSGKVKNPWPNVDAHSGSLLMHFGIKEFAFYTVMFGVSRAMGVLAAGTWSRALGMPIERPKSMTSEAISQLIASVRAKK